ncbi:polyadenylate-binding protein-interacting protein 3-like [Quillaja saponaria]|uniref:Polyadenylate-binding protein-interacting protein 3-like n=1 Tax=Quillaja saponaria TaxID=32244 RepID=A0AAD7L5F3_QUISA|nr:polyadenylate-binding protein-interacting protein 3-like [Quillaja saponaria]
MNSQQVVQPKSSSNGYGRRKADREGGTRMENKMHSGKSNSSRLTSTGAAGSKAGSYESPSRDRLVYVTTCLIGHQVEVQVKNGSTYSGIFHATNADKDFGIILKMARLTKDGSLGGQKSSAESVSKALLKTLIIPAKELVQVVAKGVSVTRDGLSNEVQREMNHEIMVDSSISQSHHVEVERELEPWVPDEDDPQFPELENIFDGHWNRGWDQFETNKTLFGVKSTFNEELYTTKLEKGPQMRELEREALRIAREIEGEETQDLHLAEERGIDLHEDFEIDEETKFSSVIRGKGVDDSGYEDNEDVMLDSQNTETFGGTFGSDTKRSTENTSGKSSDGAQISSIFSSVDLRNPSQSSSGTDLSRSISHDHAKQLASELPFKSYPGSDGESRIQENSVSEQHEGHGSAKEDNKTQAEDIRLSKSEDSQSTVISKTESSDKGGLSPNATSYAPSSSTLSKTHEKTGARGDSVEVPMSGKAHVEAQSVNSHGRPGSSASSSSDYAGCTTAASGHGLSPSSSMGSLSSEKSSLNPNAKEFRLNPNAKSFVPSQTPVRPPSPVSDGSFYFPNVTSVPHMPGMPMGVGIGHAFAGQQPLIFNQQVGQMQSPQAYFHPNGPQYGQQMLLGQPRQVLYMPNYQPEMPYKGRDY